MTREEAIEYWEGLRKTFSSSLEKEENCFGRMHLQTTIDVLDVTLDCLREQEERRWIPVTERLPKDDSNVLAYLRIGEEGRIYPANYAKGVWWDCIFSTPATKTTTHWMPLPEPPKEESE